MDSNNSPKAAFTVKHELISWFKKNYYYGDIITIHKMKDNPSDMDEGYAILYINELLEQEK
jgi:hypothetical protein